MSDDARQRALDYVEGHNVMTLATAGPDGPWAAALFYASEGFRLIFLSAATTRHARNVAAHPRVSATIQEDYRDWQEIKGVQLEGDVRRLEGREREAAVSRYARKFDVAGESAPEPIVRALARVDFYALVPARLYFIDNSRGFGHRDDVPLQREDEAADDPASCRRRAHCLSSRPMAEVATAPAAPIRFETHPSRYVHWKLAIEPPLARLVMDVREDSPLRPGYPLKTNSYDLGVDLELFDAIQRLRFEHPEVRCVVLTSAKDRIFCSGANIYMLGSSSHGFKVNFCKYTNETRLALEDASSHSGLRSLCAVNGACAGGGYELALACDYILLVDDSSSAVSLPEVSLLGVLPGTGGLTRVVDKRKVRRDHADVFSSLGEGVKGKRAREWRLVDETVPLSKFAARVPQKATELAAEAAQRSGPGVPLLPLEGRYSEQGVEHRYVTLRVDAAARTARLIVLGPDDGEPTAAGDMRERGCQLWALRAFRELDDVLLELRFNRPEIGVVVIETRGSIERVLACDQALGDNKDDWFVCEVIHHMKRVLKRLDLTARSFLALIDPGSCFAGSLFELALAADRSYMLSGKGAGPQLAFSWLNGGALPMSNGWSRLRTRFQGENVPGFEAGESLDSDAALEKGLVTFAPDEIDWQDEVRLAIEERASLSPDALTGMEANLRFAGPETMETKIFGRLSAWQNWIFQRPNAVGERGALTLYGKPERAKFNWTRT